MNNPPFPLEGGSYRVIDGKLVREDAAPPIAEPITDGVEPAADVVSIPAFRGRKPSREE